MTMPEPANRSADASQPGAAQAWTSPPDSAHAWSSQPGAAQTRPDQVSTGQARPDQPLHSPLPYGTGFSSPQPLGFGVGPADVGRVSSGAAGSAIEVTGHKRAGSPVLAAAGLLSLAVAVWAILGAPVITPTVLLAGGLVLTVLVGLVMVIRR